jgi:hypothetical protein
MATIACQGLYDQKKQEFAVAGSSAPRFQADFINAVNRALRRINIRSNLSTALTTIENLADTITVDNEDWEFVISDLVTDELVRMGQRPAKGVVLRTLFELNEEVDLIRTNILNTSQDSDPDDESEDNVGLGHLGP